ncbi:hypothetical protein L5876_04285 [Hyphobacterium sp. SN044]|uniref:hypothetical protein n=1 Tax=Hyphobacterium sp. SN044 TaxID=2912575 RepID=UPI001F19488C|nr:hypothetical protein [Hyphobacterium sp. SN044]MCF8879029.1 hypothetical protein [Hyphobacterium sp. SN044]
MIADAARADAALLTAVEGCHVALREARDHPGVVKVLFSAAAAALEQDARALNVIPLFRSTGFDGPQLLPAFWSLPYDERLAACLIVVEEFDPALASATSNVPATMLADRANRAIARLSGTLPHRNLFETR